MDSRKPSKWSREDRDRPVTREDLWHEIDMLQQRVNTQFFLLSRRGEQVSKYPDVPRRESVVDPLALFTIAMSVIAVALLIATLLIDRS